MKSLDKGGSGCMMGISLIFMEKINPDSQPI